MDLLLDTRVFIWWDIKHQDLGGQAARAIADPANQIFVSAVSASEIAIKRRSGKLHFPSSVVSTIQRNGFFELPILPVEAEEAGGLNWSHTDPFDRLLVAQASLSGLTLVTADHAIRAYGGTSLFWAGA